MGNREIAEGLDELEAANVRVTAYRRNLPLWTRLVLAYPHGWTTAISQEDAYPSDAIDHLDTLADRWEDKRPSLSDDGKCLLREALGTAEGLLRADPSLSPELRSYISRLLREIQAAFDDEVLDERFDYEDAARRL